MSCACVCWSQQAGTVALFKDRTVPYSNLLGLNCASPVSIAPELKDIVAEKEEWKAQLWKITLLRHILASQCPILASPHSPYPTNFISHNQQNSMSTLLSFSLLSPYNILLLWGGRGVILTVWNGCAITALSLKVITHTSRIFFTATAKPIGEMTMVRFAETQH